MTRLLTSVLIAALLFIIAAALAAPENVDTAKVQHELKQILARPEYQPTPPSTFDKWAKRIGETIKKWLGIFARWLFSRLSINEKPELWNIVGAWAAVVGFVVLLALLIKRTIAWGRRQIKDDMPQQDSTFNIYSACEHIRQAADFADSGDYRGAFKAAYLASIAYLDEIKALRFERSHTNWEYLQELRQKGHSVAYDQLLPLTSDFDRKIYGGEACLRDDYLKAVKIYDQLSGEGAI
ncbi:MAG: hypothetical protein GX141_06215 [Armatimonadetes bacterium]|jgi:hypothetical protein|nr:hypothetical protein [Armatimonadota bacterium]